MEINNNMALALTIFTIITGTASLLGFLYIYLGKKAYFKRWAAALFASAFIWSGYILVYPTSTVKNVEAKFTFYKAPTVEEPSRSLIIQRGEFTISDHKPLAIEFDRPYRESPKVEVINFNGHGEDFIPSVVKITPHQVIFKSSVSGGLFPNRHYKWVARGAPLEVDKS
jgi:hypothetical protein